MSISYWLDRSSEHQVEVDVAIIGGGIAGLSTAYWLAKEDSSLRIAIVEKGQLGSGATGRNAGFITCGSVEHFNRLVGTFGKSKAHEIWRFSEINLELLKEHIIQDQHQELGYAQKGSFSLASTEQEMKELKKSYDIMNELQIEVDVLEGSDVRKRLGAEGFVGGIKYCQDASVHPIRLLQKIQSQLNQNKQIQCFEHSEVYTVEPFGDGKIVRTQNHSVHCQILIYATNGYSPLLSPYFKDKIFPTRGQILVTEPLPQFMEGPCYANFVLDYFRQLPTGEMIIGGFRQLQKDAEIGYADITSDVIQNALEKFLDDHIPPARGKRITHRWSGIMGFSVDGQVLIGSLPNDPQSFFVGGFTAHGLGLAFHSGKCLVDLIFGREIPAFISARRF